MYDVIVVGGGPAGLSAALVLGRCRRRVVICDAGNPRNAASHGLHCYLTRDGILPAELRRLGREEIACYGIEFRQVEVRDACQVEDGFAVQLADGAELRSRKLLLATGVVDHLPEIEGLRDFYGRSVFHCPYCDGWEASGQPLAVFGRGKNGAGLALSLTTWSGDIVLCTDGGAPLAAELAAKLAGHGIAVRRERIARLEGRDGALERVVFRSGEPLPRRALFFSTGQGQRSHLPRQLGCLFNLKGTVRTNRSEGTTIPGLYVAGDASHDVQFVVVAAAEGAKAAVAINKALQREDGLAV